MKNRERAYGLDLDIRDKWLKRKTDEAVKTKARRSHLYTSILIVVYYTCVISIRQKKLSKYISSCLSAKNSI